MNKRYYMKEDLNSAIVFAFMLMLLLLTNMGIKGEVGILATIVLLSCALINRQTFIWGPNISLWILYYSYCLLISFIMQRDIDDLLNLFNKGILFILVLFLCNKINYHSLLIRIRNIGIVLALAGVLETVTRQPLISKFLLQIPIAYFESSIGTDNFRTVLLFYHPILLGVFFCFFWSILLFMPLKNFYFNCLSHIAMLITIYGCKSRSSWVGILIMFMVYCIKKYKHTFGRAKSINRTFILNIGLIIVMVFILNLLFNNPIGLIIQGITDRISGSLNAGEGRIVRLEVIYRVVQYWIDDHFREFFWGGGNGYALDYWKLYPVIKGNYIQTVSDNQYITILLESGIIGLIPILLILINSFVRFFKKESNKIEDIANLTIIGFFVSMFFYESFNYYTTLWIVCFITLMSDSTEKLKGKVGQVKYDESSKAKNP